MIDVQQANELEENDYGAVIELMDLVNEFEKAAISAIGVGKLNALKTYDEDMEVFTLQMAWEETQLRGGSDEPMFTLERRAKGQFIHLKISDYSARLVLRATDIEQAASYVQPELATEENAALLEKYDLSDMANIVRKAINPQ